MKILYALVIVCTAGLAIISNIPEESSNRAISYLIANKLAFTVVLASLILLVQLFDLFYNKEERVIRRWARKFIEFIAKEDLGGGEYNTRISIFRPQKGIRFIFRYVWCAFVVNFINNFKYRDWGRRFKNIPIHLFSDYLTLYVRFSHPKGDNSFVHFRLSDRNRPLNGIADKCFKEGREIEVTTCNISAIELPKDVSVFNSRLQDHRDIRQYMKDSFIGESNYSSLCNMTTKANNLYALPIINEEADLWGVLIVDNVGDDERHFQKELKDVIEKYAKIFSFTLSTVR